MDANTNFRHRYTYVIFRKLDPILVYRTHLMISKYEARQVQIWYDWLCLLVSVFVSVLPFYVKGKCAGTCGHDHETRI